MANKANPKGYGPGEKPLVLRRTADGLRVVRAPDGELGLPVTTMHELMRRGELVLEATLRTKDGEPDMKLRAVGFQVDEGGKVNYSAVRFEQVGE